MQGTKLNKCEPLFICLRNAPVFVQFQWHIQNLDTYLCISYISFCTFKSNKDWIVIANSQPKCSRILYNGSGDFSFLFQIGRVATYQCCHNNKTRRWYEFDIRSFNAKMQFSSFFVFFFGKVKRQVNLNFQCCLNVCQHSIDKRNQVSQRKLQFYIWMNCNMIIPDTTTYCDI